MIRARLSNGDFVFGLDAENVRRLTHGEPIAVDLRPMGGTCAVLVVYGHTTADVLRDLERANGQPLPEPSPLYDEKPPEP